MKRISAWMLGGPLLYVLISSLALVAVLTGVLNTLVISKVINNYLANAQEEREARDLDLANGFYTLKMQDISSIGERAAVDTVLVENISAAIQGDHAALQKVDQELIKKINVPIIGSSQAVLVLDLKGNIIDARSLNLTEQMSVPYTHGNWSELPIVADELSTTQALSGTEVIPADLLAEIGLDGQARMLVLKTAQESPDLFNSLEGSAGLALTSVTPMSDSTGQVVGAVVSLHLFNNDFSFVDNLKNVGKIDTATVFLGDLRVSTNVLDQNGKRAVGTRVSQTVYDNVLTQGKEYLGRVFVVDAWYIGRYEPLRNHQGNVIGMLYVGVREALFKSLLDAFNRTAGLVALISIIVAVVIAFPLARLITRPIVELVDANRRLAEGDMSVRVEPYGRSEISLLGHSFNKMVETLRATERELLHKENLASMGQLAAGVAHELNNPLSTILLYSDMMYKETSEDDQRHEDLKMVIDEAQRCKVIVADLLNFARQQEVQAKETDLGALVQEVIIKVNHRRRFDKVQIVRNFSPDLPSIQADPAQLQQVFINLLNNAADAMETGGTITISAVPLDQNTVEVRVADTGTGIPPENLNKLFTPFFTTKPAGKGTGLGLSIVYGIIKMHYGQIHAESEVGKGTTIVITLPVRLPDGRLDRASNKNNLIG
ncbi:MAG TPA: cache domain-containing protein [Anaerolineales bacterium]|nr:cache domain-containing protein [Anaerolineales bacterium]